jgi:hypothetical protein
LALGAAAAVAAAIPAQAAAPVSQAATPAWIVGTPGEYNWQAIFAKTEEEAIRLWVEEETGLEGCERGEASDDCDCEFCCSLYSDLDAERVKEFDGKTDITPGDWLSAGKGHICSRCGYETSRDEGGKAIGKEAVCSDCMTLADWDIVDPERAAEIRADQAEEPTPSTLIASLPKRSGE